MEQSLHNDKNIYGNSTTDSHDRIIQHESFLQNYSSITPSSSISNQDQQMCQEINTLPDEKLTIKPYEQYEIAFTTNPLVILYVDKENNYCIEVDLKRKAFIKYAMDKNTALSNPIPINFKNKNEKALYKRTKDIHFEYNHTMTCLII